MSEEREKRYIERTKDWRSTVNSISAALAAIAFVVGVPIALWQTISNLDEAKRYRTMDSLTKQQVTFISPHLQSAFIVIQNRDEITYEDLTGRSSEDMQLKLRGLLIFFEFLAYQVERECISFEDVFNTMGFSVMQIWDKTHYAIKTFREKEKAPRYLEWFQKMAERCEKRRLEIKEE